MDAPKSYKDPFWSGLASGIEQKLDLPGGLLVSVLMNGERTNADQVPSTGARTPFQIIPATAKAAVKKYGIDPYLSPQNAAEVAGLLLKDSLARNGGDAGAAVAEYHGGTNRDNWGPITRAYVERVKAGIPAPAAAPAAPELPALPDMPPPQGQSTFDKLMASMGKPTESALAGVFKAYQSGQMPAADAAQLEEDIRAGRVMAPRGVSIQPAKDAKMLPAGVLAAYGDGRMNPREKLQLEADVRAGLVQLPQGMELAGGSARAAIPGQASNAPPAPQAQPGIIDQAIGSAEAAGTLLTGGTTGMLGGIIGAAGGVLGGQDGEAGFVKGMQAGTYAPRTESGQAQAGALGAAVNDYILPGAAALPGMGPVVGALGQALSAAGGRASSVLSKAATGIPQAAREVAAKVAPAEVRPQAPPGAMPEIQPAAAPMAAPAAAVAPMTPEALGQTARTAAMGGRGSKAATQTLADQAMPSPETVAAAKKLGIEQHLQPDHVTTNETFRQINGIIKSSNPVGESALAESAGLKAVAARATKLIEDIGGKNDLSELHGNVRGVVEGLQTKMKGQADTLWSSLRDQISVAREVELPRTSAVLESMRSELGGQEAKAIPAAARKSLGPILSGEPITYGFLDLARKQVGRAIEKASGPFVDMEMGTLKRFYSALSADQEAIALAAGDKPYHTFQAAKYATRLQKGFENDLSSLFGRDIDRSFVGGGSVSLPGAMRGAAAGDSTALVRLLNSTPKDMRQQMVASGLGTVFRNAATRGDINFTSFAKWYEGLMRNKQAHSVVMSNLPAEAQAQIGALYKVSKGISDSMQTRIATGRLATVKAELLGAETLAESFYAVAKKAVLGASAEAITAPMGFPGAGLAGALGSALTRTKTKPMAAVDALLASPAFEALAKAQPEGQAVAAAKLAKTPAFKRLVLVMGRPAEMLDGKAWILEHMRPPPGPQQQQAQK